MNKTIVTTLLITSVFLTGCSGIQENTTPQQPITSIEESNIFRDQLFTLKLPAPYKSDASIIEPRNEKDFPFIVFSAVQEKVEIAELLEIEKESFRYLWTQTGPAGEFISSEQVEINNEDALKFTIQYPGRGYDAPSGGFLNEYHYSIPNGENLFRFWTSATDLENPEEISKSFDNIIETISFN